MYLPPPKAAATQPPEWYQIYFLAVLESDESKVLLQIERAGKAITDRLVQLRWGAAENPQELHDLNSAFTYLRLLFENLDTQEKGSYELSGNWVHAS
jgi:hypothetical protein